ncbi:potassium channel family protein [Chloroflexota bacterium]
MKVIIMGCGRVGARLAEMLDDEGNEVTVLDNNARSFRRLPQSFKGRALLGSGLSERAMKEAGIEEADIFVALTQGDNRNIMAAQMAKYQFNVSRAVCRIYDPLREELFSSLGLETLSPTVIFTQMFKDLLDSKGKEE